MLIRMLRGQELHSPDTGVPAGGSGQEPAAAADAPSDAPSGAETPEPSDEPDAAVSDAQEAADEPEGSDDDDLALTAEEWEAEATRARKDAARYRTKLRAVEAQLAQVQAAQAVAPATPQADPAADALAQAVAANRRADLAEAAADAGVPAALMAAIRELGAADGRDAIAAALGKVRSFLAPSSAGGARPPDQPSVPATLAEQIKAAETANNTQLALRLKAQQLAG